MTEADIDGAVALALREKLHLTQPEFWGPVGVTQSAASRYENKLRSEKMMKPIRTLIFIRYVAGLQIDASTRDGVRQLKQLAKLQRTLRPETEPATAQLDHVV